MAKKQKHPEHENLERWLVSYADFITLLFATFVVLYALAQVDATDFAKLEESLKNAFSQNTLFDGQQALMDGSDSIFDQQQANSFIPSLMLEYISPRYEEESFKEIEESIQELTKAGELDGGVAGAEGISGALRLDGHAVVDGVGHLAGQEAAPDQHILILMQENCWTKLGCLSAKNLFSTL